MQTADRRARWFAGAGLVLLVALTWWLALPQQLGGRTAYVTTYGVSMEPGFRTGDLAVVRPAGTYAVGDVVAYRSPLLSTTVMHRVVAVEGGRYTVKGDNNAWVDPEQLSAADVIGRLSLRVPRGGVWLDRLTSPTALGLVAFALVAGGGGAGRTRRHQVPPSARSAT